MTSYEVIYDKFIKKLKGDDTFFNYGNLSEIEIQQIVDDHLLGLLHSAIDKIYTFDKPDYDFYGNKDDILLSFSEDLIPQEIALLSELMYVLYISETKNRLNKFSNVFRSNELNVLFSPANERRSLLEMIDKLEIDVENNISNYLSRDRETWNLKSVYGGN